MFDRFKKKDSSQDKADAGKGLRLMALTTSAGELGFAADEECPRVFGVLTDWKLGDVTASILATKDGTASLYTTSTFGVIGGIGHETVRQAAKRCTKVAGQYYDRSTPVSDYPYPRQGEVNFYLLAYDGVRLCVGNEVEIKRGTDPMCPLFAAVQDVLTQLRLVTQPKMKQN